MALRPKSSVAQGSLAVVGRGTQPTEGEHGAASLRTNSMFTNASDLQITNSNLTVAGGDIHNVTHVHYHYESKRDIWTILSLVPNFRNIYHDMLEKVTLGTGMWLVKGDKFRVWLEPNGDIRIFWGSGIPGAGKSVLATIVIQRLEALRKELGGTICVCYVYVRYSDRTEMTIRNVLETIVKQILERHPNCQDLIESTYAQHLKEGSEPTVAQLLELLQELAGRMVCTFYVLDALDEAPTKIQLVVVKTLASLNVKLFITSRPLETVQAKFPQAYIFPIAAQDIDLDLHIVKAIEESADLQHLLEHEDPPLKAEIISIIKQKCGGMFLHASLQLEALHECISAQQVRCTLEAFPSKIEDVYIYTWNRILDQNAENVSVATAVFIWVLYAKRSMTIEELRMAIATSPDTHKFQADRMVPRFTLISLCRGLVTVEEESSFVRLVHYTAKDPLQRLIHVSFPHPHSLLAAICMTHLTERGFQNTKICSETEFDATLKADPLLAYASEAWHFHVLAGSDVEETKHRSSQFVKDCHAFPAVTDPDRRWTFDILTPLHVLALYKLPIALIKGTTLGNPNVTATTSQQTPLIAASGSGHEDLVARLIALSETQVNFVDHWGWTALIWAARKGQEGVVKLLLAHPATDVNLVDKNRRSALAWAARSGWEGVAQLLLAHPAIQVNHVEKAGWSPLILASFYGKEGVAKLLIAHSAIQVNLADRLRHSALIKAAIEGHEGVAKLLLAHPEIEVNQVDRSGWSALMHAARKGARAIVQLLLAHPGIEVNLVDMSGTSALISAIMYGHSDVAELLLSTGAIDVNAFDNYRNTPLKLAAKNGHEGVVRLLLAVPDIDTTIRSTHDRHTAMSAAQAEGHNAIVELLREFEARKSASIPEVVASLSKSLFARFT